jgi:DNA polymerase-3 subunit epsilon
LATAELFEMLLARDRIQKQEATQPDFAQLKLQRNVDPQAIAHLPETCGVYYFYNALGDLIYVGKSVNIRSRVLSHFANASTRKAMEMKQQIASIDYAETGSELIALLKESEEIKEYKPLYNRAQRREANHIGLFQETDAQGYLRFRLGRVGKASKPITTFSGNASARGFMEHLVAKFELCEKLAGIFKAGSGACFKYHIQQCQGACLGLEAKEDYNERAKKALQSVAYDHENMIILDAGRTPDERSVVVVERGKYLGFGYTSTQMREIQWLRASVKPARDNRDVHTIIKGYLTRNPVEEVIIY